MKILLALVLFCTACHVEQTPVQKEPLRPVRLHTVSGVHPPTTRVFSGVAKAGTTTKVSFRVGGLIKELPVKVGDRLSQGQLIAALRDQDLRLELEQATSTLEQAEAEARNAKAQYRRVKALYENDSASRHELDAARAGHEAADASVAKAQSGVQLAQKRLGYATLLAPSADCTVQSLEAEVNENVSIGQPVATLTCGKALKVEVAIPETYIARITGDMVVSIRFNAIPERVYEGSVTEIGVVASGGTTYPVTVDLKRIYPELRSGMASKVSIEVPDPDEGSLLIPSEAVGEDRSGHFVYVFEPGTGDQGIAKRRTVTVGVMKTGGMVVLEGLAEGEEVITAGVRYLKDGKQVKRFKEN